jgi:hypothetical protein
MEIPAGNSEDKYKGHWTQWQQWCQMMEIPVVLPHKERSANTLQLAAFAAFLFLYGWSTQERGNQHGTIASKISAIRWHHRALVGYEPETDAGHALLMQALKRLSKPVEAPAHRENVTWDFWSVRYEPIRSPVGVGPTVDWLLLPLTSWRIPEGG